MSVLTSVPAFTCALNCTVSHLHSFALRLLGQEPCLSMSCLILGTLSDPQQWASVLPLPARANLYDSALAHGWRHGCHCVTSPWGAASPRHSIHFIWNSRLRSVFHIWTGNRQIGLLLPPSVINALVLSLMAARRVHSPGQMSPFWYISVSDLRKISEKSPK